MHAEELNINIQEALDAGPVKSSPLLTKALIVCLAVGIISFTCGLATEYPDELVWGSFYTSAIYWLGLSIGGVITTVIFQIVRAKWSPPVRRIAEANIAYVPWGVALLLCSYFGKEYLFPWATSPMPGREEYMQPEFAFVRIAVLFFVLFCFLRCFTRMSLRGDIGMAREQAKDKERWKGLGYKMIVKKWQGLDIEVPKLQARMSYLAPLIILVYVVVYTVFATEMIVGMDTIWFSNMFGGFEFLGNIYMGWAMTALIALMLAKGNQDFNKTIQTRQFWDLGMLCLGFSMLWGYTFFAQFLPQWYGNMPEETQWLILRSREMPWKQVGWLAFTCCFILPFVLLLSEDVKKTPWAFSMICLIILAGVWVEKYVIIMPELASTYVPFSMMDVGIFLGFLGLYGICVQHFLTKYPFIPVSHPLTRGSLDW